MKRSTISMFFCLTAALTSLSCGNNQSRETSKTQTYPEHKGWYQLEREETSRIVARTFERMERALFPDARPAGMEERFDRLMPKLRLEVPKLRIQDHMNRVRNWRAAAMAADADRFHRDREREMVRISSFVEEMQNKKWDQEFYDSYTEIEELIERQINSDEIFARVARMIIRKGGEWNQFFSDHLSFIDSALRKYGIALELAEKNPTAVRHYLKQLNLSPQHLTEVAKIIGGKDIRSGLALLKEQSTVEYEELKIGLTPAVIKRIAEMRGELGTYKLRELSQAGDSVLEAREKLRLENVSEVNQTIYEIANRMLDGIQPNRYNPVSIVKSWQAGSGEESISSWEFKRVVSVLPRHYQKKIGQKLARQTAQWKQAVRAQR